MSDAKIGQTPWNKGKTYKLSAESLKNKPNFNGENNPFYGKHHTEESLEKIKNNRKLTDSGREKIRAAHLGKSIPDITKNKISKSLIGRKFKKETLKKMSDSQKYKKKVLCYDLNNTFLKEFNSINEAASTSKTSRSAIKNSCNDTNFKKLAGGFKWRFKYE